MRYCFWEMFFFYIKWVMIERMESLVSWKEMGGESFVREGIEFVEKVVG